MLKRRMGGFYRRLLLLFLLICAVPTLLLAVFSFRETVAKVEQETKVHYETVADSLSNALTGRFEEVYSLGQRMNLTPWVSRLRSNSDILFGSVTYNRIGEIKTEITLYETLVGVTSQIGVYLPNRNMTVTRNGLQDAKGTSSFPLSLTKADHDLLEPLLKNENKGFSVYSLKKIGVTQAKENDCLVVCRLDDLSVPRAILYCYINGAIMEQYLFPRQQEHLISFTVIIDENPLMHFEYTTASTGNQYAIKKTSRVAHSLISFEFVFDGDLYSARMAAFGKLYAVLALVIVISLILSLCMADINYKPIRHLVNKMGAYTLPGKDEIKGLESQYDNLQSERDILRRQLEQYEGIVHNQQALSLLHGLFNSNDMFSTVLRLPLRNDVMYSVIVFRGDFSGTASLEYARAQMKLEQSGIRAELIRDEENDLVLIFQTKDKNFIEELFTDELESMESFCGFSSLGIIGISKSYLGIRQMTQLDYYYPIDWELQLIGQIKQGHKEVAQRILNQVREENQKRSIDEKKMALLNSVLMETLLRVAAELGLNKEDLLTKMANKTDAWEHLADIVSVLCDSTRKTIAEENDGPVRQLVGYVNEHYNDPNISLAQLQDIFGYSQSMLSRAFKKATRLTYYDYLCQLRIEKAKRLMREGTRSLTCVAKEVGFINEVAFQRVFKRYTGTSPRDYLNITNDNEAD